MKTRDRILDTARERFNEEGLAQVSANRIAAELGISPGNLHYHFKKKEEIVGWLLRRFADSLRPLHAAAATVSAIDDLWLSLHLILEATDDYRFISRDADYLVREFPALEPRLRALTGERLAAMQAMYAALRDAGTIAATGEQMSALALQTVLSNTAWYSFERLLPARQAVNGSRAAAYHVLMMLSPYVNDQARQYLDYLRSKYALKRTG